jgi:ATP-dependent Clp protease ATP-binding subunit ClpC
MFERYTERARRVIFFARYEASQFGIAAIEVEHLLLGLIREEETLISTLLGKRVSLDFIREEIVAHTVPGKKISTSVELPLTPALQRVLAYALEESEKLKHKHIGTEHMVLGLLREEGSLAANLLVKVGLSLESVREFLQKKGSE